VRSKGGARRHRKRTKYDLPRTKIRRNREEAAAELLKDQQSLRDHVYGRKEER
jgi:hypothetical protein